MFAQMAICWFASITLNKSNYVYIKSVFMVCSLTDARFALSDCIPTVVVENGLPI